MNRREFHKTAAFAALSGIGRGEASNLPPVDFTRTSYRIGGKPAFLYSGEFHYFRVPKPDWRRRMELFKEAGGNAIATYIPWLIHEPSEGNCVFGGEDGVRDFEGFLATARDAGLYVIARPGPYQYSELKYDGLPAWLCENYPEIRAHDIEGKPFRTSSISYVHPLFLEKTRRWYDRVCPMIAKHTLKHGGPIAFTQIDNELTGIHVWFGGLDYNAASMGFGRPEGRYPRFLRTRYGNIAAVNAAYETSYADFESVRPIAPSAATNIAGVRRAKDYFDFYLSTIAEYAKTLVDMMRERGIDTPIVHNSANPEMNASYLETAAALGSSFLLGSDHYYNLDQTWAQNSPTPQYATGVLLSLEMLKLMGFPPTVFELPGGSASDWPPFTPEDARTCYWTNLAYGMKGANYYIFTGGPNPPDAGATTDLYDYGASIGARNEVRPLYAVQQELGLFVKSRPWLAESDREYDCRFAFEFDFPRSEHYWTSGAGLPLADGEAWTFFRKGALTSALCASVSPALCDLAQDEWTQDTRTPLVVVASSSLARSKQERVIRFLRHGGDALLLPVLPSVDERLQPCTALADFLGAPAIERNTRAFPRVTIAGVANILDNGAIYVTTKLPAGAEILGRDERSGRTVGWRLNTEGGGRAIFLGMRWIHAMREHDRMLEALLKHLGLDQKVVCSNPNVWTSLRTSGTKSVLFLMNLFSAPMEAEVSCRPAWAREVIRTGRHKLGPMSAKHIELSL